MKPIENSLVRNVRWMRKWFECTECKGRGFTAIDPLNLDDDREKECGECLGEGGYEKQVPI